LRVCVHLTDKKLAAQYKWAENNAIPYAILVSKEEEEQNRFTLRHLANRENHPNLTLQEALTILQRK
jgi:histidyl-tRNA synthetase